MSGGERRNRRSARVALLLLSSLVAGAPSARAYLYPGHRAIMARGIEKLDPRRRAQLDRLWMEARKGHEARLCEQADAGNQGEKPSCIDYAAPAIAGDHSCSPDGMLQTVLQSDWILKVAAITARMEARMAASKTEDQRRNRTVDADLHLTRTDPEYTTRALLLNGSGRGRVTGASRDLPRRTGGAPRATPRADRHSGS
jgi:hypothetical protein